MASIETQLKAKRDLRRIENAAERLLRAYMDEIDAIERQMRQTPEGERINELKRRVDGLDGNAKRLLRMQDDARDLYAWVDMDLRT